LNNKGQVLVLFVLILPIFLLLAYFVYNELTLYGEKKNQEDLTSSLCKYYKKGTSIKELEELALKNDKDISIKIENEENNIKKTLVKEIDDLLNKKNKIKTEIKCE